MNRVLIANRGEVAVRIARACADTGRTSIAVYADPDADALHVARADEAYALDGTTPADTYLDIGKLLAVAKAANADAVHPGYGFLSESAAFAQAVVDAGLIWIGPSPECIESLGDKVSARRIAESVGAPLVAGTPGPVAGAQEAVDFAREHGLPIAIKAAFGGGGRGLKVAWRHDEIVELYDSAVREAVTAFGRGECFIERYLDKPRHVEVQVLADTHGTVAVLGTRDCSLQRRNQKLVEEAPAPFLSDEQRRRLHTSARDICAAAGYSGAGTVEFLLSADGTISFLEVNTRLQVEHPVTEETTGVDLVAWQFRIAEGERLDFEESAPRGHAIEFRINAEDPGRGFLPTPGRVVDFRPPSGPGVRLDSGVESGSTVPGSFDSLMAKLIVWGESREQALARARRALGEFTIEGVASVLPFHRAVVDDADFAGADALGVHTRWIETEFSHLANLTPLTEPHEDPGFVRTWIEIDGRRVRLGVPAGLALRGGEDSARDSRPVPSREEPAEGSICAPLTGTLVRWTVADGDVVSDGDAVAVMEAMKMETQVMASREGSIRIVAEPGEFVESGTELGRVES